jgi:phosphogluconate dehydratase
MVTDRSASAPLHPELRRVTERIAGRSAVLRGAYLQRLARLQDRPGRGSRLGCANLAHTTAALPAADKLRVVAERAPHLAVVTAYNDMLSAHQPYEDYPQRIRAAARALGATVQVAGGVPAMCDGITQGQPGMELSLFSRDTIAMSTAVALSHDVFDGVLLLGVCDKIVPGLLIGALHFGHLPCVFVPAGPMSSGLSNPAKARVREQYAAGQVGRDALLEAESAAYHGPGTCTFYGTANSNQMLLEAMGLHVPGAAFVHPHDGLRHALTDEAVRRLLALARPAAAGGASLPIGRLVDERVIVNAIVALLATGGSTNHLIHWVAVARAAGILIDWTDFADLSAVVPLLARVYPNGQADVNRFQAAGGPGFVLRELLDAGLMHADVATIAGSDGLRAYTRVPVLQQGRPAWPALPPDSGDSSVLRPAARPFAPSGGLQLLQGNLGRGVIKVSAVPADRQVVEAPARVFDGQEALHAAFAAGELDRDVVVVVRFQGPRAAGMPELHKLTPPLAVLQDRGHRVALVTDGRMSGASGKVPAAIHCTPEALDGGPLARLRDGDRIRLDAPAGRLEVLVEAADWAARRPAERCADAAEEHAHGLGRELFAGMRRAVTSAEEGAITWL